jgi:hypothetical protein
VDTFARFLKQKVDKKRNLQELFDFVMKMDVNKDGFIDNYDIETCFGNLNNDRFYEEHGEVIEDRGLSGESNKFCPTVKLSNAEAAEVCK